MKKIHPIFLVLLLLLSNTAAFTEGPADAKNKDPRKSKVDALFKQWDSTASPGCALAVIQDGQIVYKRGYGMADLEHGIPISSKSIFYIGSTSKQFVSFSILLLEEQRKLSLDDDIRKFIPEFPQYDERITIRHLIHHTSGIRDYLTLWSLAGNSYLDYMPEDAVLELICNQKELNFAPGTRFLYSNSCYFLLSVIVKRASGKSLRKFADEHIFGPLGMENSHFHDDNRHIVENRAFGYTKSEKDEFQNLVMRFDLVGSGGLYTSVEDLYLWDQNFYNKKLGKGGPRLINSMLTNGKLNNGNEVDYAFALRSTQYRGAITVQHGGALGGYRTQLMRFPDLHFSVIILSNLAMFNPTALAYQVADIYLEEYLMHAKSEQLAQQSRGGTSTTKKKSAISAARLREYTGKFYSDELQVTYHVFVEDGQLQVKVKYDPPVAKEYAEKDVFKGPAEVAFQRDANDNITGFILDAGRVKNLKFIRMP